MGFLDRLTGAPVKELAEGVRGVIDELKVDDEERAAAKAILTELQIKAEGQLVEAINRQMEAAADIIKTELTSESWIARNWRATAGMAFTAIAVYNFVLEGFVVGRGWAMPSDLPGDFWLTLQVALGGYATKVTADSIGNAIGKYRGTVAPGTELLSDIKQKRKARAAMTKQASKLKKKGFSQDEIAEMLGIDD